MSRFNAYMNSGFAGCRLLAYTRDECRHRDVRLYQVPGYEDVVGVADGTDSWIAPVSANIMSVNVRRLLDDLQAGIPLPKPEPLAAPRRTLVLTPSEAAEGAPVRRRPLTQTPATEQGVRRRAIST